MKYSIDKQEKYTVFSLHEENLNSTVSPNLKSELVILSNEGIPNLILNLTDVKYVDSSGLSAILTANRLWKSIGTFVLTGINHEPVRKLIEISRLESVLTILANINDSKDFVILEEIERSLNDAPTK